MIKEFEEALRWIKDNDDVEIKVAESKDGELVIGVFKGDIYCVFSISEHVTYTFIQQILYPAIAAVRQESKKDESNQPDQKPNP